MKKIKNTKNTIQHLCEFRKKVLKSIENDYKLKLLTNIEKLWEDKLMHIPNIIRMIKIDIRECVNDDLLNTVIYKNLRLEKRLVKSMIFKKSNNLKQAKRNNDFDEIILRQYYIRQPKDYAISNNGRKVIFTNIFQYQKLIKISILYELNRMEQEIFKNNEYLKNQARITEIHQKKKWAKINRKKEEKKSNLTEEMNKIDENLKNLYAHKTEQYQNNSDNDINSSDNIEDDEDDSDDSDIIVNTNNNNNNYNELNEINDDENDIINQMTNESEKKNKDEQKYHECKEQEEKMSEISNLVLNNNDTPGINMNGNSYFENISNDSDTSSDSASTDDSITDNNTTYNGILSTIWNPLSRISNFINNNNTNEKNQNYEMCKDENDTKKQSNNNKKFGDVTKNNQENKRKKKKCENKNNNTENKNKKKEKRKNKINKDTNEVNEEILLKLFDYNNIDHLEWFNEKLKKEDKKKWTEELATTLEPHTGLAMNGTTIDDDEKEIHALGINFRPNPRSIDTTAVYNSYRDLVNKIRNIVNKEYEAAKALLKIKNFNFNNLYDMVYNNENNDEKKEQADDLNIPYTKDTSIINHSKPTNNKIVEAMERNLLNFMCGKNRNIIKKDDNLTKKQRKTLERMKNDKDNAYVKSDKSKKLIKIPMEGENNFREKMENAIKKASLNQTNELAIDNARELIHNWLTLYKNEIHKDWVKYLLPRHYKQFIGGKIKINIKDHKANIIDQVGRTIQSVCGSPTENIGRYLQKIARHIKNKYCIDYDIKDSLDLCDKLDKFNGNIIMEQLNNKIKYGENDDDYYLEYEIYSQSVDVEGMFPSYQHKKLKEGFLLYYEKEIHNMPKIIGSKPSMKCISNLLDLVLKQSILRYNGKFYVASSGAPQGGIASCDLCDIAQSHFYNNEIINLFADLLLLYNKYRDDTLLLTKINNSKEFSEYVEKLNSIDDDIQFTYEFGERNDNDEIGKIIEILNLTLFITKNGTIKRIAFSKPNNNHMFMHEKSCQPEHIQRGIVKGIATTIKMITDDIFVQDVLDIYMVYLVKCGYKYEMVNDIFYDIKGKDPKYLRKKKNQYYGNLYNINNSKFINTIESNNIKNSKLPIINIVIPFMPEYEHWKTEIPNFIVEQFKNEPVLKAIITTHRINIIFSNCGPTIGEILYPNVFNVKNDISLVDKNNKNYKTSMDNIDVDVINRKFNKNGRINMFNEKFGMIDCDNNNNINTYDDGRNYNKEFNVKYKLCKGNVPCKRSRCKLHQQFMIFGDTIKDLHTGNIYRIKDDCDCNTKNIIYAIICLKCGKFYIGSTQQQAKDRFTKHLNDIINGNIDSGCGTAKHFNQNCFDMTDGIKNP